MILIRINCPDADLARTIAREAVERRLAAAANIEPPIRSVYRWKGAIEEADETPLVLKTRAGLFADVAELVRRHHPYETPAILAIPVSEATVDYAAWLAAETGPETGPQHAPRRR